MKILVLIFSLVGLAGCGVRGKPQPPLTPAEIGRGQPTFKGSTEEYRFKEVPTPAPETTKKNER